MIEPEVAGVVEGQAPLAVGGDAPAEVCGNGNAFVDRALHVAEVTGDIVGASDAVGGRRAAVLDQDDRLSGKLLLLLAQDVVDDRGPDRRVRVPAFRRCAQALNLRRPQGWNAPIVVESDEVDRAHALRRAEKGREPPRHPEIPPVRAE